MEKIVIDLDVKAGVAESKVKDLIGTFDELKKESIAVTEELKKTTDPDKILFLKKKLKELNGELGKTGKEANDAGKKGSKGIGLLSKGFKVMGVALKAAGIGLFLAAIGALFEVMRKNQKVLDAVETATNFIALGFKAVTDAVTTAFESVNKVTGGFDALKKVVGGLVTLFLLPLKLVFYELKQAAQVLKVAYESIFGDDKSVKQAKIDLEATRVEILKVAADGVEAAKTVAKNLVKAVIEVGDGVSAVVSEVAKIDPKKLYETADAMTVLKNNAEVAAAVQAGLIEKNDRLAEKQRQIRDEERNSIADRKKANDELLVILQKQEIAMLKEADAQIKSAQAEVNALDNQENRIKLIEAENNKLGVKAQITGLLSEQKVNDLGLDREQIELTNAKGASESMLSIERKRFNAEQITDELGKLQALKLVDELEKEQEAIRLQAIVDNANAGTQAKIDAQIVLDEFMESARQKDITSDNLIREAKLANQYALASGISKALGDISQLFEKGTAASKAAALAEMVIGTGIGFIQGLDIAQKGAKATGPAAPFAFPIFYATQIAAVLGAAGKAKNILSQVKGGGSGGGAPSAPSIPPPPSVPPSFNVVGSSETNQLAGAIGSQAQQPTRAYVVSGDVTTAQGMDRSIIEGASI